MTRPVRNYYEATRRERFVADPFVAGGRVDVVIVGGGLTGLNAALELAGVGLAVCVLESRTVGWGGSGRSGGQIIAGLGGDMGALERSIGLEACRRLWALTVEGLADMRMRIHRNNIDCDLADGHLCVAHNAREAETLRRQADGLVSRYDYAVRFLDRSALREHLGGGAYHGALYDPGSGHLHPLNYTLGVARIARDAGAAIHEGCQVTRIGGNGPHRVETSLGMLTCDHVLLCTNAYLENVESSLRRYFIPVGSHIVATEPLGAERARELIPCGAAVSDTRRVLDYYRVSGDHRLLFGGRVGALDPDPVRLSAVLRKRIERVFPALGDFAIDYAWGGHVAVTLSHAPHVGRLRGNIFFAQGYTGHGMVLSGVAGRVLAQAVTGALEGIDLFARLGTRPIPLPRSLLKPALAVMLTWFALLDRL